MARLMTVVLVAGALLAGGMGTAYGVDGVAITAPSSGASVGGPVLVTATAPQDATGVAFAWSHDGGAWTAIGTDTNAADGWGLVWSTRPHDGPVLLRAAASGPLPSEAVISLQLINPPVVSVTVSESWFSPNGDGRKDTSRLAMTVNEAAAVTLQVLDADGKVRRSWKDTRTSAGTFAVRFDGKASAGRVLPDGVYRVRAHAKDLAGHASSVTTRVVIDTVAPRIVWSSVSPEPSSGKVKQTFSFSVRDADTIFTGALRVTDAIGQVGSARSLSLSSRSVKVPWSPPRALYPGTYQARVRLVDRAGNVGHAPPRAWRVHRSMTGRVHHRVEDAGRRVALTFDDCHDSDAWRKILDVLRVRGLKASFFCPGEMLSSRAALARRTVRAGHSVGSHGWDHARLSGRSDDFVRSRLLKDRKAWWRYGGATSAPYFRPPYGAYDARVVRISGETSMPRVMMWDVDPQDWRRPGTTALVRRIGDHARGGSIVVLHTIGPTAAALPKILDRLKAKGLRPVSLDELFRAAG